MVMQGRRRLSENRCIDVTLRAAFAYEPATIQRCWLTWNVLCTFLYTAELIAANPMPLVGRPKLAKTITRYQTAAD